MSAPSHYRRTISALVGTDQSVNHCVTMNGITSEKSATFLCFYWASFTSRIPSKILIYRCHIR